MKIISPTGKKLKFNNKFVEYEVLMYHTNFSNFDLTTGIDIPLKGKNGIWQINNPGGTGIISSTTKTINGVTYPCLYIKGTQGYGENIVMSLSNLTDFIKTTDDIVTIETTVYKDDYYGRWGGVDYSDKECPYYNCWTGGRGLGMGIQSPYKERYNGYTCRHDGWGWYNDDGSNIPEISVCGITRVGTDFKYYSRGKKAVWQENVTPNNTLYFYAASNGGYGGGIMEFYILDFKIYKGVDKFEEME